MGKKLSEMSLEELWQLFPILLTEYQPCWKEWYMEEAALLERILPAEQIICISHIGSTAIEGIWAKPIVDILVEVEKVSYFSLVREAIYACRRVTDVCPLTKAIQKMDLRNGSFTYIYAKQAIMMSDIFVSI